MSEQESEYALRLWFVQDITAILKMPEAPTLKRWAKLRGTELKS